MSSRERPLGLDCDRLTRWTVLLLGVYHCGVIRMILGKRMKGVSAQGQPVGKCVILGTPLSGYLLQPTWQIAQGGKGGRVLLLGCCKVIGHM